VGHSIRRRAGLIRGEGGQDLIEYALLAGLISIVAVLAITNAGAELNVAFERIVTKLQPVNR
jgi:Flp pilus assembly pilin Flp